MRTTRLVIFVNIAALFVEGSLYGVFTLFICIILSIALGPKHSRFVNRTRILQISGLMFILATLHLVFALARIFVDFSFDELGDITASLKDLQNTMAIGKTFISMLQVMLGDGILVWRCYVLNNKMVWVLIPGIIVLTSDTGILVMYTTLIVRKGIVFMQGWPVTFPALSIALHTTYTATIVWRVYHTNKSQNVRTSGRSLTPVMAALIESGAIYSATAIILLICISMNSPGLAVVMDAIPPLVGIAFCLVILQIHVYYVNGKDREPAPGGVSANWSIPWRRRQRDVDSEVSEVAP